MKSIVLCCVMFLFLGCAKKPIDVSNNASKESIILEKQKISDELSDERSSDTSDYECESGMVIKAKYMTKDSSDIAILSIPGQGKRIFVRTFSASGVEYVSGEYVWSLKGDVAYLNQLGTKDITCKAIY